MRFFTAIAEDVRSRARRASGARSLADVVGDTTLLAPAAPRRVGARPRPAPGGAAPGRAQRVVGPIRRARGSRSSASPRRRPRRGWRPPMHMPPQVGERPATSAPSSMPKVAVDDIPMTATATVTTADRSFGAHVVGLHRARASSGGRCAGASRARRARVFGAFARPVGRLELAGQANDYVGKGLSGGTVVVRPERRAGRRARASWPSPATRASTARPAAGCTSSAARGSGSRSATAARRRSSRASARTAAST